MICIVTIQLITVGYLLKLSKNDKQKSRNADLCQNRGKVHQDIKSRITYSVVLQKLNPDDMTQFIYSQLDLMGLGHHIFSPDALHLIVKSSEGILRRTRNLCLSCMLESVRKQTKEITLDIVNSVLMQPHWRKEYDLVQT